MLLSHLWHTFWFLQLTLYMALCVLLAKERKYRQFPFFSCYIGWTALEDLVLLGIYYAQFTSGNQYAVAYAVAAVLDTIIRFAIIYEVLNQLLRSYPALRNLAAGLFRWATVALLAAVIGLAWLAPGIRNGYMSIFFVLQRTVDVLLCGLLVCLFAFSGFFHLTWRSHVVGIAVGLAVVAAGDLAAATIVAQLELIVHNQIAAIMQLITQSAYLCSALVWIGYLVLPEPTRHTSTKGLPKEDLESWNQELQRLLHP